MTSDPLQTLVRLRQAELDEVSRRVGAALEEEAAAETARAALEDTIARETDAALYSDADTDVERFARWLRHARTRLQTHADAVADAATATATLRAELALVRARARAAANALERRQEEIRQQRLGAEQRAHDEVALRRPA